MSEVLRDLVVSLSLKTENFSRNINSINRQTREAESTFKLTGAGVDKFGTTNTGMASRITMLQTNSSIDSFVHANQTVGQSADVPKIHCEILYSETILANSNNTPITPALKTNFDQRVAEYNNQYKAARERMAQLKGERAKG